MGLSIHPAVADDLAEAAEYYLEADPELPKRLRGDTREAVRAVGAFPYIGRTVFEDYRQIALRVFPYLVIYRVTPGAVRILAVLHAHRDPASIELVLKERERRS